MLSDARKFKFATKAILLLFAFSLLGTAPVRAEERYPDVARLSFVSGGVTYSRGDDPDEWDDAVENVPLTVGDRVYAPADGRAELELSSGNFVRLAPRSYVSTVNLSDDIKQFYLGEGSASFNIRRLASEEDFEIDTPNVAVTFEEPGLYRVAVDENGDSRITVRRGRATVAANGRQIAVENSEIRIYGSDSPRYEIAGLPAPDSFDRWVDERNFRFDRAYADAYRYASEGIVGAADLNEYGRWEDIPEYGYAWTPAVVAAGWAPFSNGRWYWQDPWGWNWISNERWGWATSHYGRWVPYRSRWYWVPVRPRTRVFYAPANVEFVRIGDNIGWFPLHPRDRYTPWWQRRDRRFDNNAVYVNRNYITVVNQNNFIGAQPVNRYLVRDAAILRQARLTDSLPIPNRSSLRIVSDNGIRRGFKPSAAVLNRAAVVRTAPPAPPRAFQDKLAEIQKNQGKAVEPAGIAATNANDRGKGLRFRPAAEAGRGDFAPRNPGAGVALRPVTEARGKKLATRNGNDATKTVESKNIPATRLAPAQPSKETSNRTEPSRQTPQDIERQKQAQEQQRQQQLQEQKQRETERRRAQQQEEERKVQAQKQATQERQIEQRSREQQRLEELERRQAQQEANRKAQQAQLNQQEQQRREQVKQQERQAQQRQQEIEQRQQEERKAQALQQQQQAQARREQQLRQQQQVQQLQAREQLRQQQAQREAQQQLQHREEPERRPAPLPRRPQPQEQPAPQPQLQR